MTGRLADRQARLTVCDAVMLCCGWQAGVYEEQEAQEYIMVNVRG